MFTGQQVIFGIVLFEGKRSLIMEGFVRHCSLTYCSVWLFSGQMFHCPAYPSRLQRQTCYCPATRMRQGVKSELHYPTQFFNKN
ncbi:hypothetical protein CKO_01622 [Citrobacter koseri ATCC BAA-895]|uniref:Uncharacterized protein n=1 Tax=Citrobacter koseri (strain ATCC BAA-895 / CDC 4225-83 / SGSC4696) TaxID=290338 RepID=A8AGZ2_CITK8|nr:hypothetical protein CKO_01622 [Citrobacter koseri ATCC BAA-895]